MEMQQVRYFLGVAEHLNFTRAADRLHVAQPSLTRAIQKLEDELGGPLFRRERANTHLTELGRMMLPHLQAALAAAEAATKQAHSFRQRETGQLALGACSTVSAELGIPLLSALSADMPGLDMRIEIADSTLLEELLVTGDLDAAILVPPPGPGGASSHERFDRHPIARNAFVVAFGPGHRFNSVDELTLEDLDGEPLITRLGCGHEAAIAGAMEARGINRSVRHRCADERWLAEMVREGLGCVLWPEDLARSRGLAYRPLPDLALRHEVALTTMAGRRHSPALGALVRHADGLSARFQGAPERVPT